MGLFADTRRPRNQWWRSTASPLEVASRRPRRDLRSRPVADSRRDTHPSGLSEATSNGRRPAGARRSGSRQAGYTLQAFAPPGLQRSFERLECKLGGGLGQVEIADQYLFAKDRRFRDEIAVGVDQTTLTVRRFGRSVGGRIGGDRIDRVLDGDRLSLGALGSPLVRLGDIGL